MNNFRVTVVQIVSLFTMNVVRSLQILVTLMMVALRSSKTSVLTRATRRNIQEDGILHSHRHENHNSYITLAGLVLWRGHNVILIK
jgi:hypothetical protein